MDQDDFDSITWRNDAQRNNQQEEEVSASADAANKQPSNINGKRKARSSTPQAGRQADSVDLAGVDDGILECSVGHPQKESDGTKDAFISYQVTTIVSQIYSYADFFTVSGS